MDIEPKPKMTKWERFLMYGDMALQVAGNVGGTLAAGLGLCLAIGLANIIGQSRFTSLSDTPTPALGFLTLTTIAVCGVMWASIIIAFVRREVQISASVLLSAVAGATLMVGLSNNLINEYRERIRPVNPVAVINEISLQPATMNAGKLAEDIARHPELYGNDAKVIALAQAIKNIMDAGRTPCPPLTDGKPQPQTEK